MIGKKAFVYGFGPFDHFDRNVSAAIIGALAPHRHLATEVFDARFDRSMFLGPIKRWRPGVIIGLGQHRRAHKLRLERKAVNLRAERGQYPGPIEKDGPLHYFAGLRLPQAPFTTVAYDAGTYVCNFSMYVISRHCLGSAAESVFIHVPMTFDVSVAAKYLDEVLRKLIPS